MTNFSFQFYGEEMPLAPVNDMTVAKRSGWRSSSRVRPYWWSGRCGLIALPLVILTLVEATAQSLPSSSDPGRIEQRFEKPLTPQSLPPVEFPAPEQAPPPEKAGSIKFVLHEIIIDGGTIFPASDIHQLYDNLLGNEVSLLDIYRIRDAITAKYRNAGYIISEAVIPGICSTRPRLSVM